MTSWRCCRRYCNRWKRSASSRGIFIRPPSTACMQAAGQPDEELSAVRPRLANWPAEFADLKSSLETASDAALSAFSGLRAVQAGQGDITLAFRALRQLPRAEEALYPLAAKFPPVSSFFLNPELCEDADLLARLAVPANAKRPASSTTTTSRRAAAAFRSTCRNITRPTAPGRW